MEQMEGRPDGWTLVEKIGSGSYGNVYKAKKEMFDSTYFRAVKHISVPKDEEELKCMQDDLGTEDEAAIHAFCETKMRSILQEFDLLRQFSGHRNFVQVFDATPVRKKGMPGYDLYIHMELLSSIRTRFQHVADPEAEAVRLGMDICDALKEMHRRNLMHRDIKSENILVDSEGVYKLVDFGEACRLSGSATNMTIRGTLDYMTPEMLQGGKVGYSADLYALGLVLYRLVNHNRFPFCRKGEMNWQEGNMKRLHGETVPPPEEASKEFASVILRALAFDPKDRWQTAEDMGSALRKIAEARKTGETGKTVLPKPGDWDPDAHPGFFQELEEYLRTLGLEKTGQRLNLLNLLKQRMDTHPQKEPDVQPEPEGSDPNALSGVFQELGEDRHTPDPEKTRLRLNLLNLLKQRLDALSQKEPEEEIPSERDIVVPLMVPPEMCENGFTEYVRYSRTIRCSACRGTGLLSGLPCRMCRGGKRKENVVQEITVPPHPGRQPILLSFPGQGHAGEKGEPDGNLLVRIYVRDPDKALKETIKETGSSGKPAAVVPGQKRDGSDVHYDLRITPNENRTGCQKTVSYLQRKRCTACSGKGVQTRGICPVCGGNGAFEATNDVEVTLSPHPTAADYTLLFKGYGHEGINGGRNGNLLIRVHPV